MERFEEDTRLASGTLQWRQARAARDMTSCTLDSTVRITITSSNRAPRDLMLPCRTTQPVLESRPAAIAELAPGIAYVDITRTTTAQFHAGLPALAKAKGIVFDLRGYPTDVGTVFLSHLIDAPEHDRWMHVARIAGPFGEVAGWNQLGWDLMPVAPRLTARRVALTDGRAISYAESVMGYIKDRKLATIVGGTTAGANGNVVPFAVPGGFGITFTGMRVTRHDGKEPHHLVGVRPDVPLAPTLAGVRAGRDELLERAIEILK
jgi:C-terminal processing protease CtpA/Prc